MEHIKRVGRELMYKASMLEFYKDTIVTPDGKTVYWDHIEHKGAAAVVAVRDDGRIIMVRQFRNSPDKETLEIPAGGINKGEPVKTAAIRELEEETELLSHNLSFLPRRQNQTVTSVQTSNLSSA